MLVPGFSLEVDCPHQAARHQAVETATTVLVALEQPALPAPGLSLVMEYRHPVAPAPDAVMATTVSVVLNPLALPERGSPKEKVHPQHRVPF